MTQLQEYMAQQRSSLPYSGIDRSAKSRGYILPKSPPTLNTSGTASTSLLSQCDTASLPSPQSLKATLQGETSIPAMLPVLAPQENNHRDTIASSTHQDDQNSKLVLELPADLLTPDKQQDQKAPRYSHGKTNRLMHSLAQLRNRRQRQVQEKHHHHRHTNSWDDEDNMSAIAVWCGEDDDALTLEDGAPSVHPFFADKNTPQAENSPCTQLTAPRRRSSLNVEVSQQRSPSRIVLSPFRKQMVQTRRAQLGFARTITMDGILERHDDKSRRETLTVFTCAPSGDVKRVESPPRDCRPVVSLDYHQILKEESPRKKPEANRPLRRQSLSPPLRDEQPAILIWV